MKELEAIKKEIDSLISKRNGLLILIITSIGGMISLSLNYTNFMNIFFIIIGLIFIPFIVKGALNTDERINCLIEELKK